MHYRNIETRDLRNRRSPYTGSIVIATVSSKRIPALDRNRECDNVQGVPAARMTSMRNPDKA
jgi:hypothetical protein